MRILTFSHNAFAENTYLLLADGKDDAVLIDPGVTVEYPLKALRESGRKLSAILLTHGHFDHSAYGDDLRKVTGAKIYIHKDDAAMLNDGTLNASSLGKNSYPAFSYDADEFYGAGDFEAAGIHFEILETPGHTPGGVVLYISDEKCAFTGDTLFANGFGRTDLPGGSMSALRRSLKMLFTLPKETVVYPGHGNSATMEEILENY